MHARQKCAAKRRIAIRVLRCCGSVDLVLGKTYPLTQQSFAVLTELCRGTADLLAIVTSTEVFCMHAENIIAVLGAPCERRARFLRRTVTGQTCECHSLTTF
jgi:hypothetical protein